MSAATTDATTTNGAAAAAPGDDEELPSKRPSIWRGPNRPTAPTSPSHSKLTPKPAAASKKKAPPVLRDTIAFEVPLDGCSFVDLGAAVKRVRAKRIESILKAFPTLQPKKKVEQEVAEDDDDDDKGEGETTAEKETGKKKKAKKKKPLESMPKPSEYGNMIEYLEAKYVQGVMVNDAANGEDDDDDDDEGQGSVYSEASFLDDTDLQRTVAEQVLANSTTTKVELDGHHDEFFVNVGTLEVEETDLTMETYDPLQDTLDSKKQKKKKPQVKRKRAAADTGPEKDVKPKAKKTKAAVKDENDKPNEKSPKVTTSNPTTAASSESNGTLESESRIRKDRADTLYQQLVDMIQNATTDELPRRKTKERVALTCPPEKKPGDSILFSNPHVPGQRLKVKIPDNTPPGGSFKVTVPVQPPADDDTDYNKLSRAFYDTLDDYARAYDDWCDAEGLVRKAAGDDSYTAHFEKRKKFDSFLKVFPQDLKTPVDMDYVKKLLRRARQNKSKRGQTQRMKKGGSVTGGGSVQSASPPSKTTSTTTVVAPPAPKVTVPVPELSKVFATRPFDAKDFDF